MLGFVRKIVTSKFTGLALLCLVGAQAYHAMAPRRHQVDFLRKTVADEAVHQAVRRMPRDENVKQLLVADLPGDHTGYLKEQLRAELRSSGKFEVADDTLVQRVKKEVLGVAKSSGLISRDLVESIEGDGIRSLEAAIEFGERAGVDGVLFGEVTDFSASDKGSRVDMMLRIVDVKGKRAIFGDNIGNEVKPGPTSPSYVRARIIGSSKGWRLLTWVLVVLLLPLVLSHFLTLLLERESNAANVMALIGLTVIDLLLAFALLGFYVASIAAAGVLIFALLLSLGYNYWIYNLLERLRK